MGLTPLRTSDSLTLSARVPLLTPECVVSLGRGKHRKAKGKVVGKIFDPMGVDPCFTKNSLGRFCIPEKSKLREKTLLECLS